MTAEKSSGGMYLCSSARADSHSRIINAQSANAGSSGASSSAIMKSGNSANGDSGMLSLVTGSLSCRSGGETEVDDGSENSDTSGKNIFPQGSMGTGS